LRIIFVRHGQTVYNNESRYQGHTDAALSDLGRKQADRVAERLKNTRLAAVYSSDLSRAKDTADAIASLHGLRVEVDTDLRECSFGEWEGLTVTEIRERFPKEYANYRQDSVRYRAPGGERLEDLQARVVRAVNRIAERHPDDTVVIATHGGPIRAFFCHALGTELATFRKLHLDNAGITVLSTKNGLWSLELLNDTCHLGSLESSNNQHDETLAAVGPLDIDKHQ